MLRILLMWPLDNISVRPPTAPPYRRPVLTKGVAYSLESPTPKNYHGFGLFLSAIKMAHYWSCANFPHVTKPLSILRLGTWITKTASVSLHWNGK